MKSNIFFVCFVFFINASACMESDNRPAIVEKKIGPTGNKETTEYLEIDEKSYQSEIEKRGILAVLPDELIVYIIDFIVQEAFIKNNCISNPVEKLPDILSDKNLANTALVNKLWQNIVFCMVTEKAKKLIESNKNSFRYKLKNIGQTKEDIRLLNCLFKVGINIMPKHALIGIIRKGYNTILKLLLNIISHLDIKRQFKLIMPYDNYTLLLLAFDYKNNEAIELILKHILRFEPNYQLNIINTKGQRIRETVLMGASVYNNKVIVEIILKHIENLEPKIRLEIIQAQNDDGNTSLIMAKKENNLEIVTLIQQASNKAREELQ